MLAWLAFAVVFAIRKRAPRGRSRTRAPAAIAGITLQVAALALIWGFRRVPPRAPLVRGPAAFNMAAAFVCLALAWVSVGLMIWAIRTLGRQWAVSARIVDGHELITTGPYALVRNPVYVGFFGLAIATGGVFTEGWAILAAVPLFIAGTIVRVRAEERLLRGAFGATFDDYARRVPALIPRFRPRGRIVLF